MVRMWTAAAAILLLAGQTALAQTATGQAMRARRVHDVIKLRLAPDNKTIEVALDGQQTFPPLKKDQTFTTTSPVAVTFERPNPLTLLVSADVSAKDDPDFATVGKLVEAMLAATNVIRPGATTGAGAETTEALLPRTPGVEGFFRNAESTCLPSLVAAANEVSDLESRLFSEAWSKKTIVAELKTWTSAIDRAHRDGRPGPAAIQAGIDEIQKYVNRGYPLPGLKANDLRKPAEILKEAGDKVEAILKAQAPATADASCRPLINSIYALARLSNPQARLADVNKIYGSITDLKATLEKVYANPANWYGPDPHKTGFYLQRAVEPSSQNMQVVSVKVLSVDYSGLDAVTPVLLAKREDLVSATFTVKQYSFFVPEVGVGATFMRFQRPKYATTKNAAGETVIGESFDELTVEPAVMLNFVVRNLPGAFFTPMAQIGVSSSKDAPTFFLGGGLRFLHTGKGDFAFSGGLAFPWVKQLKSRKVGDVVGGMKEIEDDLKFQPVSGHQVYWMLQYKF